MMIIWIFFITSAIIIGNNPYKQQRHFRYSPDKSEKKFRKMKFQLFFAITVAIAIGLAYAGK